MTNALALAASALAGIVVYWIIGAVQVGRTASRALADFRRSDDAPTAVERLGMWLSEHLPLPVRISEWQEALHWAQRGGYLKGVTVYQVFGEAALYTVLGYLFIAAMRPSGWVLWLSPLLPGAYPLLRVKNRASRVRRAVRRTLPETASLIAAEMAAGNSAEQALGRAAEAHSALGVFLQEVEDYARAAGRPMFSQPPIVGALVEYTRNEARGLPFLMAFVTQLDMVARKGVSGAQLMADIAQTLAREHHQDVMTRAKTLDSKLVVAAAIFYFMPFVALLLFAFAAPALRMFTR